MDRIGASVVAMCTLHALVSLLRFELQDVSQHPLTIVGNELLRAKIGDQLIVRGTLHRRGNDIYIVHFANGSAEWRIGLVKEGKIGRIALGPQY